MPRFKGSCGCYNREDARTIGLVPAIVWNDMLDRAEHFDANPMWYDQKNAADRLGMSETSLKRAVDKLVEAGRITKRKGYRPGTTISTTWITIFENVNDDTSRKSDLTLPRKSDLALPILNDTNNDTNGGGSIIDYGMMKALVQKFVRDHQSQSDPITFTPSKLKEYYPSLKEWAIDNGINLDRAMINTVLENAYSEMTNDGWLAGKDIAIAFKDTCIGTRIKKQQKKGGLNDNEW